MLDNHIILLVFYRSEFILELVFIALHREMPIEWGAIPREQVTVMPFPRNASSWRRISRIIER